MQSQEDKVGKVILKACVLIAAKANYVSLTTTSNNKSTYDDVSAVAYFIHCDKTKNGKFAGNSYDRIDPDLANIIWILCNDKENKMKVFTSKDNDTKVMHIKCQKDAREPSFFDVDFTNLNDGELTILYDGYLYTVYHDKQTKMQKCPDKTGTIPNEDWHSISPSVGYTETINQIVSEWNKKDRSHSEHKDDEKQNKIKNKVEVPITTRSSIVNEASENSETTKPECCLKRFFKRLFPCFFRNNESQVEKEDDSSSKNDNNKSSESKKDKSSSKNDNSERIYESTKNKKFKPENYTVSPQNPDIQSQTTEPKNGRSFLDCLFGRWPGINCDDNRRNCQLDNREFSYDVPYKRPFHACTNPKIYKEFQEQLGKRR